MMFLLEVKEDGKMEKENIKEQLDFVLDFIKKHGMTYDYVIRKALDDFELKEPSTEEIVKNRKSMYERLSKLW